jgi:hypothetical protein
MNRCEYDRKCLKMIEADAVIAAVERQVARQGTQLTTQRISLTPLSTPHP